MDNAVVAEFPIIGINGSKTDAAQALIAGWPGSRLAFVHKIIIPLRSAVEASVIDFSGTQSGIARMPESGDERFLQRNDAAPIV